MTTPRLESVPGRMWPAQPAGRVNLLKVDPDLAAAAGGSVMGSNLAVPVYRLRTGPMPDLPDAKRHSKLGFLVLKGLILCEVTVCGRTTAELVGSGDVVRPAGGDGAGTLPSSTTWTVLEQALLAELESLDDPRMNAPLGVIEVFVARASQRAESVAIQRSIASHVRVDVRVLAYLWHLADRFGVVVPGAVRLSLPLTHAVLARLVGARRPTVTTALQRLMHLGYLRRDGRAFVLLGGASSVEDLDRRRPARDFVVSEADAPSAAA